MITNRRNHLGALTLADAIANFEGYHITGSVANRNNNPGNLRFAHQVGATGQDAKGFAIFGTPEAGQAALDAQIALDASRGLTLGEFIGKYAPPSENNTSNYLSYVSSQTGIPSDQPLSEFASAGFRRG